jgi:hypothetical protein
MQTGNLRLDKQLARWYPLKDHPVQLALIGSVPSGLRFPLVPAGRRSGKTERFKRFLVKQANTIVGPYFAAAPTHDQAKKIFWNDLLDFSLSSTHKKRPNISERIIYLNNGSEIHVIGLDKPQRIEGIPWIGGGIDEFADIKPEAWEANIYPALNTVNPTRPDYRAWCWLLGVPDGLNHYYDLCEKAKADDGLTSKVFNWMTEEIFPEMAAEAKKIMSERQYNVEFRAAFETASGRVYTEYDRYLNGTDRAVDAKDHLHIGMDFNVGKMSAIVHVKDGKTTSAVDEIMGLLDTPEMIKDINDKYPDHKITIYPDASGKNRDTNDASKTDISLLKKHFIVKNKTKNPFIKDRVASVQAMLCNAAGDRRYLINRTACPQTCKALESQTYDKSGKPDKAHDTDHPNDALGYYIHNQYPIMLGSVLNKLQTAGH